MTPNTLGVIVLASVLGLFPFAGAHRSQGNSGVSRDDNPGLDVRTGGNPLGAGTRQRDPTWRYGTSASNNRRGHPFNGGVTNPPPGVTPPDLPHPGVRPPELPHTRVNPPELPHPGINPPELPAPGIDAEIGFPRRTDDYDHERTTTPENAVYIFTGFTTSLASATGRRDLCSFCLCTNDKTRVFCQASSRSPDSHILILDQSILPNNAEILAVEGYERVKVEPGAFSGVGSLLKTITFQNIAQVLLEPESFYFQPEAMCHIYRIESEAVWRARLMILNVTNAKIEFIAEGAIDVDVAELAKFKSNQLPFIRTKAICLHAKSTVFLGNAIHQISNQSIVIETEGLVLFRENIVETLEAGGLAGIQPQRADYGASITLDGNLLRKVEPGSLALDPTWPQDKVTLLNNTFDLPCECNLTLVLRSLLGAAPRLTRDREDDFVGRSRCRDPVSGGALTLNRFQDIDCRPFPIEVVSSVGAALVLLVVTITVCVVCSLRVQRVKDEVDMLGDCASRSFSTLNQPYILSMPPTPGGGGRESLSSTASDTQQTMTAAGPEGVPASPLALLGPWAMAVPELKTYKEDRTPAFTEEAAPIRTPRDTLLGRLHPTGITMRASNPLN